MNTILPRKVRERALQREGGDAIDKALARTAVVADPVQRMQERAAAAHALPALARGVDASELASHGMAEEPIS
ncbi:hypothetical protein [Thiomonas sp.]